MSKQVAVSVYIHPDTKKKLEEIASRYGQRQFNRVVNDAIREYLEKENNK